MGPFGEAVADDVVGAGEHEDLGDAASVPSARATGSSVAVPVISRAVHRAASRSARAWRQSLVGSIVALGLLDAFVTSLAPSAAVVTLVVALGPRPRQRRVAGRGRAARPPGAWR